LQSPTQAEQLSKNILRRWRQDGGFADVVGGGYRPDATAWAVIALSAAQVADEKVFSSRNHLATSQGEDGRVSLNSVHPQAHWPTSLASLAWAQSPSHLTHYQQALEFLLNTFGAHWEISPDSPVAHDTSIRGWSWISGTHSWVEPTALSVIALKQAGYKQHERVLEAAEMLLDRQLPQGGWNYGNTSVFGQELQPMPWSTGMALQALVGLIDRSRVLHSLEYLQGQAIRLKTPLSLGWALLGLGAWGEYPIEAEELIQRCVAHQQILGGYTTTHLSLLLLAQILSTGLLNSQKEALSV